VSRLRRKLEAAGAPAPLRTLHGAGYLLEAGALPERAGGASRASSKGRG